MNVESALKAYSQANATEIEKASAHRLIELTFTELRKHLHLINSSLKRKTEISDTSVAKVLLALSILTESLDMEKGGDIAENLSSIYSFCRSRVAEVFKGSGEFDLDEIIAIVNSLTEAWSGMEDTTKQ
jgi:flagellar protein FliS